MYDLYQDLQKKIKELDVSVKALRQTGTDYAQAEMDYKIALSKETVELRNEGMAVTMIPLVIYGKDHIAKLRFKRDVAEAVYNANQESINAIKLQIRIIEGQINREMGQAKYE